MRELLVLGLSALFAVTQGYVSVEGMEGGKCANTAVMTNFNIEKFQGVWLEAQSVPNIFQLTRKCTKMEYSWNGNVVKATTKGLGDEDLPTEQSTQMTMKKSRNKEATFIVDVKELPDAEIPFQILSTDYDNYACVYSCLKYEDFKVEFKWVLRRDKSKATDASRMCKTVFQKNRIDISKLTDTYQGPICASPPKFSGLPSYMKKRRKNNGDKENTQEKQNKNTFSTRVSKNDRKPKQSSWKPYKSKNEQVNGDDKKSNAWKPYQGYQGGYQPKDADVQITTQKQATYKPYQSADSKPYVGYRSLKNDNVNKPNKPYVGYRSLKNYNINKPKKQYVGYRDIKDEKINNQNQWKQSRSSQQDKVDLKKEQPKKDERKNTYSNWSSYRGYVKKEQPKKDEKENTNSNWPSYRGYQTQRTANNISPKDRNVYRSYRGLRKNASSKREDVKANNSQSRKTKTYYNPRATADGKQTYGRKSYTQSRAKPNMSWSTVKPYQKDEAMTRTRNPYAASAVADADCKDKEKNCRYWASSGECKKNQGWMNTNCGKSCGKCGKSASSCVDKESGCQGWATMGECKKNPRWMNANCARACAQCS